jgi:hypothetical protein
METGALNFGKILKVYEIKTQKMTQLMTRKGSMCGISMRVLAPLFWTHGRYTSQVGCWLSFMF